MLPRSFFTQRLAPLLVRDSHAEGVSITRNVSQQPDFTEEKPLGTAIAKRFTKVCAQHLT